MNKSFLEKINSLGISYKQYLDLMINQIESSASANMADEGETELGNIKLNLHRMNRIEKHYTVSEELKNKLLQITEPQTWMIISETWCGDSAQNIPFIAKMAEQNSKIKLAIILRDANPEIMDLYLTDGTRSIPIFISFNDNGEELFRWGSRPKKAVKLFADLKKDGLEKSAILEKLHLWYGRNRGKDLEVEIMESICNILSRI